MAVVHFFSLSGEGLGFFLSRQRVGSFLACEKGADLCVWCRSSGRGESGDSREIGGMHALTRAARILKFSYLLHRARWSDRSGRAAGDRDRPLCCCVRRVRDTCLEGKKGQNIPYCLLMGILSRVP